MPRFCFFAAMYLMGLASPALTAQEALYQGTWNTTNRKLDGTVTCALQQQADERWKGRFYGVWQGVSFDYTVTFSGPESDLRGTATIDGADYVWRGIISDRSFRGSFGGSRYEGYFVLKEKRPLR